jgi:hypothetical protein
VGGDTKWIDDIMEGVSWKETEGMGAFPTSFILLENFERIKREMH